MSQLIDLVNKGEWRKLFIEELGWSRPGPNDKVQISIEIEMLGPHLYQFDEVAQYRGIRIFVCPELPDARAQRLLDRQIRRHSTERLIIFSGEYEQEWRWPRSADDQGQGKTRLVSHRHKVGSSSEALSQRLSMIEIGIDESPSVIEVLRRLRAAFDADRITRAFYKAYVKEHSALCTVIEGIDSSDDREWYSTLLLNRLMFVYFMQRKGFMDSDKNYLANRLQRVQESIGQDKFLSFFRGFLLPLFHAGLGSNSGKEALNDQMRSILGDVPYVNGGIFSIHELEERFDSIEIPDEAFTRIFRFFDSYQWHLNDSPTGAENEISPDVLGYIFEQFITYEESGKREKGAYYTKEDVTGYMTVNTVTTRFLDRLEGATGVTAFHLLREDPERYIPESLGFGYGRPFPEISDWRAKASSEYGLPGENWYEVRARHERYESVLMKLKTGEVTSTADLITYDLNIEELALDAIALLTDSAKIGSAWAQLQDITVLDPTCGSGAFLFAALERMQALYLGVLDAADAALESKYEPFLGALVTEARRHPNRDYFVLKQAAQHNIFGVDLMRGAAEIARLRLYLKLVAQLETRDQIEPLPDLEFNIKTGNLLVGASTADSLVAMGDTLDSQDEAQRLSHEASAMSALWEAYVAAQETRDDGLILKAKKALQQTESNVRERLDRFVFGRLGTGDFATWRDKCQPFHWFAEFSDVFNRGGFEIVIGNPPYIAKNKVDYSTAGHRTSSCPDIYAMCMERAVALLSPNGRFAMIVMSNLCFSSDFSPLRAVLRERLPVRWLSSFSRIPAGLFTGARVRNSIVIGQNGDSTRLSATGLHRWEEAYRPHLLQTLNYSDVPQALDTADGRPWPFVPHSRLASALWSVGGRIGTGFARSPRGLDPYETDARGAISKSGPYMLGFRTNGYNWLPVFVDIPPAEDAQGKQTRQTQVSAMWFKDSQDRDLALALLSSRWAYVWWAMVGDDFHVTSGGLLTTPLPKITPESRARALNLVEALRTVTRENIAWKLNAGKRIGNWYMPGAQAVIEELDSLWGEYFMPDSTPGDRLRWLSEAYYFTVRTDLTSREASEEPGGDDE